MANGKLIKDLESLTLELFRQGEYEPTISKDAYFLALKEEFKDLFEASEQAQKHYDTSLQRFGKTVRSLWFCPYLIFPSFRGLAKKSAL